MNRPSGVSGRVVLSACVLVAAAVLCVPLSAADFTWTNTTPNGWLSGDTGYNINTSSNWSGNVTPTFDSTASLLFSGFTTNTTIFGGFGTTTMNRMTVSTETNLRFNSVGSTFNFTGDSPTIDTQTGLTRLEVKVSNTSGLTKTGTGTLFSNLQSVTAGFTGPFTISEGLLTSGNNWALGEAKTVNIASGASADMAGMSWAAADDNTADSPVRSYTFNIAGTGNAGLGAIYNSAGNVNGTYSGILNLNLTANASVGGTGIFHIGNFGAIDGNGFTLTKIGTNEIWVGGAASEISYQVNEGTLVGNLTNDAFGGAAGSVSVAGGATLASSNNRTFATPLTFADGATLTNKLNAATWSGNVSLTSGSTTVTGASASTPIIMSGTISGNGGITKAGANTLTLSNINSYSGVTHITSGTLRLASTGLIAESGTIRVAAGASFHVADVADYALAQQILTGAGTVVGDLMLVDGSTIRPGSSPGTLTVTGDVVWNAGGNYDWEIHNATGTAGSVNGWDLLSVGGSLDLSNLTSEDRFLINLWSLSGVGPDANGAALNFDPNTYGSWTILTAAGGITGFSVDAFQINVEPFNGTGGFANTLAAGAVFRMEQVGNNLNLVYAVPEPSTCMMALAGLAYGGYAVLRRGSGRSRQRRRE